MCMKGRLQQIAHQMDKNTNYQEAEKDHISDGRITSMKTVKRCEISISTNDGRIGFTTRCIILKD